MNILLPLKIGNFQSIAHTYAYLVNTGYDIISYQCRISSVAGCHWFTSCFEEASRVGLIPLDTDRLHGMAEKSTAG